MIIEIEKLKKIDDIISCEGSVLSVYKYSSKFYLASHLSDGTGVVFYSTNAESLLSYLHSKITLSDLYQLSNDVFVTRKFQKDSKLYLSEDFYILIQYGEFTLNQLNKNLINHDFILKIINNFLS
jgi:hypothetical protein